MRTSYKNIFLLACCQALLLTNSAGLISMNGLVGYTLAGSKSLATLGASTYVIGSALATMPMSLWMARVGRRRGFMTGALVNIAGCALAALALSVGSFVLYCLATAISGIYNAVGLQYRFAATEVAATEDKARAISLVLAGGIVGGFLGPAATRWGQHLTTTPFLGSFLLLGAFALVALAVQAQVNVPRPTLAERQGGGRPLREIVVQPRFAIAALVAATSYGLMNLLMTATPLAMDFCAYPYGLAVLVIQWHVVGMYAPAFITGNLMKRFSVVQIIGAGLVVMMLASLVALHGVSVSHFMVSMLLVGLGWNFMYTGGTLLLTDAYSPAERAQAQGANDFFVFAVMGVSSFTSGALISGAGWAWMNWLALIILGLVSAAVAWFAQTRPSPADDAALASGG